ncbi:hypothetical protein QL285_053521 [Trifolium repens]|nr:hypothetical protein QL285_053521 [Trifolium repens]
MAWRKLHVTKIIAKRAIHHYNKTNETNFEVVTTSDTMRSCSFSIIENLSALRKYRVSKNSRKIITI